MPAIASADGPNVFVKTASLLEAALATDQQVAEFVCDITKCFNALHRKPIKQATLKLGMSAGAVSAGAVRLWHS